MNFKYKSLIKYRSLIKLLLTQAYLSEAPHLVKNCIHIIHYLFKKK